MLLGKVQPSHVLAATEISLRSCAVRVSLGWSTGEADIEVSCRLEKACKCAMYRTPPKWLHWRTFSLPFEWFKRPTCGDRQRTNPSQNIAIPTKSNPRALTP